MKLSKQTIFKIAMFLLPIMLLFLLESVLRFLGISSPEPLFTETREKGKAVHQLNPYVAKRYFDPKKISLPTLYPQTFSEEKSTNTFRIFCLGGSSTAGIPFDNQVPFPWQLQYLLSQKYPGYSFEVLNVGLSAINSFSVLDFIPDILEKSPDLILIYMGHNEFYGAYGSASAFSIGNNGWWIRFYLKLQRFHLVQLIKKAIRLLSSPASTGNKSKSLMEVVTADKNIPYHSEKYWQTLNNFEDNLQIILQKCIKNGTQVIIGNLASNLSDLPPFASISSTTSDVNKQESINLRKIGKSHLKLGEYDIARETLQKAVDLDSASAENRYLLGKAYTKLGEAESAIRLFTEAKDRDVVRFRASEDANRIITRLAKQYETPLVNIPGILQSHSPGGLVGNNLMSDHLHPNPQGYYLLAKGFYNSIVQKSILKNPSPHFIPKDTPYFVTDLDWDIGQLKIYRMINRWPFPEKNVDFKDYQSISEPVVGKIAYQYIFRHQNWRKAHFDMASVFQNRKEYAKAQEELLAVHAYSKTDVDVIIEIAKIYKSEEKWDLAEKFYQKAATQNPNNGIFLFQLAVSQWKQKNLNAAITSMEKAISARDFASQERLKARYYLAGFLAEADQSEKAKTILELLLSESPQYKPAQQLLQQLQQEN